MRAPQACFTHHVHGPNLAIRRFGPGT